MYVIHNIKQNRYPGVGSSIVSPSFVKDPGDAMSFTSVTAAARFLAGIAMLHIRYGPAYPSVLSDVLRETNDWRVLRRKVTYETEEA